MDEQSKSSVKSPEKKKGRGCLVGFLVTIGVLGVLMVCGLFSLIILAASQGNNSSSANESVISSGSEDKVVVIHINGVISGSRVSTSTYDGVSTPDEVIADLNTALQDESVKAIVLEIESPGGEVVASDQIYRKVLEARTQKPIIAYSANMAASGGYYIAAGADEFIVHPGVITGSIGVILQTQSLEGLYEKLGIETNTFKSGDFKDNAELYGGNRQDEIEGIYQTLVDEYYEEFLTAIVDGRGIDKEELRKLADGRIYNGTQAEKHGLVDGLGYREAAIDRAQESAGISGATVVEYERYDYFGSLFGLSALNPLVGSPLVEDYGIKAYYLVKL